jgi:broad specificity phosphatase PhoE
MNKLYLIRHGENIANITKELSSKLVDYSLTPKGVLQAQQTAEYFCDKNIHEIYSSPLKRAYETANIIATRIGLTNVIMDNFREINVGNLELQPSSLVNWARYKHTISEWFSGNLSARFPGGEDYHILLSRMQEGVIQILDGNENKNILVIGHGGIFTATISNLCQGVDMKLLLTQESYNCSITEIDIAINNGKVTGTLQSWASYAHLHGKAADLVSVLPNFNNLNEANKDKIHG